MLVMSLLTNAEWKIRKRKETKQVCIHHMHVIKMCLLHAHYAVCLSFTSYSDRGP